MANNASKPDRLFGTDGIRGTPGEYPLTDGMIYKIGSSIAKVVLYKHAHDEGIPRIVIGKDTRLSGGRIETILYDAITKYGVNVLLAGIMTTPGLSFSVKDCRADMGLMISASHNKPSDNGIKLFNAKGYKLLPEEERWIEDIIFGTIIHNNNGFTPKRKGSVTELAQAPERYLEFLKASAQGISLKGMRIAIDCCWGSTSMFAKRLFERLGAEVCPIHDLPDGENINMGGTMNPHLLKDLVIEDKSDVGFAFDGDGDRATVIDGHGTILDGDYILAMIALHLLRKNKLANNTIVATVMSNYGLKAALEEHAVRLITTEVGDKHVLEALIKNNVAIGGEQSGHIIFLDYLPTPDGMLTALQVLKIMQEEKRSLVELARCITKYPQILLNVRVREKRPFDEILSVRQRLQEYNEQLKGTGRILLRYSGTEALARIMVEGKDKQQIEAIAQSLADVIKEEIGLTEEEALT